MDEAELRRQLEQHHAASYGWALNCCRRDAAQAEDVLQTVYLKVLDGRARFDGQSVFKTWLFAVIRHTAADERRRHWLRQLKLAAFGQDGTRDEHEESAEKGAARAEMQAMFQEKLAALPSRQREVLHLVFYQDLSIEQAAGVMGVSVGSARTHYARGKQRLRERLNRAEVFDETGIRRQPTQAALR